MNIAFLTAMRSEDRSSWIGAVIVGKDKEIISTGYNGFPRGVKVTEERMERPAKYAWTEHGERNAIYNAARTGACTKGATMYTHGIPCMDCARAVIQAGITRVVTCKDGLVPGAKWEDHQARATMLKEAGVDWTEIEYVPIVDIDIFMGGKYKKEC